MVSIQTFPGRLANNYSPEKFAPSECGPYASDALTVWQRLLAKRLVARSRWAKHPRQNPVQAKRLAKSEQAKLLVTKPAKISLLRAQEKLAVRPGFSSTLAERRFQRCSCAR
jgi:hypothetical protein